MDKTNIKLNVVTHVKKIKKTPPDWKGSVHRTPHEKRKVWNSMAFLFRIIAINNLVD